MTLNSEARTKTKALPPSRRNASLRILRWQALLVFLSLAAIAMGVTYLVRYSSPAWKPQVGLVFTFIIIFFSQIVIWLAYHHGIRDAHADTDDDSQATFKA